MSYITILECENHKGYEIIGSDEQVPSIQRILMYPKQYRFESIYVAKVVLSELDKDTDYYKYHKSTNYLDVKCSYWNKCPFHIHLIEDNSKNYKGMYKINTFVDHDHTKKRHLFYKDIDLTSPNGNILCKKRKLEMVLQDVLSTKTKKKALIKKRNDKIK